MASDRSVILVIPASDTSPKRVIKVGFAPFTIGTNADADVRVERAESWFQLRVIRREGRFRIVKDADEDSTDSRRGAWLTNGINLSYGGVQFRFFTHLAAGASPDARSSNVEIITSPAQPGRSFEPLTKHRVGRRKKVEPYVPRSLVVPAPRERAPIPHVDSAVDGAEHLERLASLAQRLENARSFRASLPAAS